MTIHLHGPNPSPTTCCGSPAFCRRRTSRFRTRVTTLPWKCCVRSSTRTKTINGGSGIWFPSVSARAVVVNTKPATMVTVSGTVVAQFSQSVLDEYDDVVEGALRGTDEHRGLEASIIDLYNDQWDAIDADLEELDEEIADVRSKERRTRDREEKRALREQKQQIRRRADQLDDLPAAARGHGLRPVPQPREPRRRSVCGPWVIRSITNSSARSSITSVTVPETVVSHFPNSIREQPTSTTARLTL